MIVLGAAVAGAVFAGGFNIDGVVLGTGGEEEDATFFADPFGSVSELGPSNQAGKLGDIQDDVAPNLGYESQNPGNDLSGVWLDTNIDESGDIWLYFAFKREADSTGQVVFEFNENPAPAACDYANAILADPPGADATTQDLIDNCNPWANRSVGDFSFAFDTQGQGASIVQRTFNGSGFDTGTVDTSVSAVAIAADGLTGEGAVNLSETVFPPEPTSCLSIANIIPYSITGNSDQADMKDAVLADFADSITISNCGSVRVEKKTDPAGDTTSVFPYTLDRSSLADINYDGETSFVDTLVGDGDFDVIIDLLPGTDYQLTEDLSGVPAYALQSIVCDGVDVTGGTFSVVSGAQTSCTITNELQEGTLTVIKTVTNDNGGTANPSDFTMDIGVDGVDPFPGADDPGTTTTLIDGTAFNVTESGPSGYTGTFTGDCTGLIEAGVDKTCTINNDDDAPSLTLVKTVTNDNGGTAVTTDFTLSADGPTPISGAGGATSDGTFSAGSYDLSETTVAGYAAGDWVCVGGTQTGDSIALGLAESATCTINNDDIQPKLTVIKTVVNDNGGTLGVADFPLFVDAVSVTSGVENGFDAGSYTVSETEQFGYAASDWDGDCAVDGSITLEIGQTYTCTITNDDIAPKLTVIKTVVNDDGGTLEAADFDIFVDGTAVQGGSTTFLGEEAPGTTLELSAGTFDVTETDAYATFYAATFAGDCSGTLNVGDEKTCTITNDDIAGNQPSIAVNSLSITNLDEDGRLDGDRTVASGEFTITDESESGNRPDGFLILLTDYDVETWEYKVNRRASYGSFAVTGCTYTIIDVDGGAGPDGYESGDPVIFDESITIGYTCTFASPVPNSGYLRGTAEAGIFGRTDRTFTYSQDFELGGRKGI